MLLSLTKLVRLKTRGAKRSSKDLELDSLISTQSLLQPFSTKMGADSPSVKWRKDHTSTRLEVAKLCLL